MRWSSSGPPKGDGDDHMISRTSPILILIAAFVLVATAYGVVVPVFESPDEHTHYFVAQHIAHTGRLPVQTTAREERGPWEQEGSQPPLYYLLVAPLVALSGADIDEEDLRYNHQNTMGEPWHSVNENRFVHDPGVEGWPWQGYALAVHLARFVSTALAALAVAALWALARTVVPERPWIAWAAAALFALNPQHLHLAGSLTNDNAMNALAAVTLWLLVRVLDGHDDRPTLYGLALAAGLAPLAKLSGLALLGFVGLTLVWTAWRRRDPSLLIRTAVPIAASALILSGWWYARNMQLYGSLTGLDFMLPEGVRRDFNQDRWIRGLPAELYGMWRSSWGLFGWFTIMLPEWVYRVIEAATVVGIVGAFIAEWRQEWRQDAWVRWPRAAWLILWWAIAFASLLRWLMMAKGAHGRLLFPAIAAPAILLVIGWRMFAPKGLSDKAFALGLAGVMGAFAIGSLGMVIAPAFARPTLLAAAPPIDAEARVDATFGESIRLIGVEHPERVTEGDLMPIRLYWELVGKPERDGLVAIRVDQTARRLKEGTMPRSASFEDTELFTLPGAVYLAYHGRGTTPPDLLPIVLGEGRRWVADEHVITVPAAVRSYKDMPDMTYPSMPMMPIAARLSIHLYDREDGESWPVHSADDPAATDVGRTVVIDPLTSDRLTPESRLPSWPIARFEGAGTAIALYHVTAGPYPYYDSDFDLDSPPGAIVTVGGSGTYSDEVEPTATVPSAPGEWSGPGSMKEADVAIRTDPDGPPRNAIRVVWRARGPADDLARFTHVVDEEGNVVAQFDGEPTSHGPYPSRFWRPEEVLVADIPWDVPPDAAPGSIFTILVGLYERTEGSPRVPAYDPAGVRWPNDAVPLRKVTVREGVTR